MCCKGACSAAWQGKTGDSLVKAIEQMMLLFPLQLLIRDSYVPVRGSLCHQGVVVWPRKHYPSAQNFVFCLLQHWPRCKESTRSDSDPYTTRFVQWTTHSGQCVAVVGHCIWE